MTKPLDNAHALHDLAVVEAMVAELEPYLKSDILYWQLSPSPPISPPAPLLTLGGILLRAHRLTGQQQALDTAQQTRLAAAKATLDRATDEWSAHIGQRLERELKARLDSWQWFVEDCEAQKQTCITYYATEAELRTVIELLIAYGDRLGDLALQRRRLRGLDGRFRRWFKEGDFVWRAELEPVYPKGQFWWLHGRPEFPQR